MLRYRGSTSSATRGQFETRWGGQFKRFFQNRQRSAKIWLETLKVADKGSLSETDLKQALKVIKENQAILIESFNNVKAGKKITTIKIK